ncbi:carboxylating nicotinate-nucleotide diphosphorylase [Azospirillum rugosum]|uniref:nicotinate-nucleotide diphosphorylase (carboxylating) n=1 Tax=Azospirillum rugosum TaxID=416170 RepID=A0ABS4SS96_9PROT|nr:carboxylating nicotinate-nucleotide diphosphorylase [Azospirillum rugosum]MBP2295440.1 nicotinate-nucleotide pyrophosphorylase (carboxylating) [Azospirillum rugosum]MDQ0528319.1 nicotinate-nucleotide pyrophosphorylase (carboxylating) [Azospirillum rugosum]
MLHPLMFEPIVRAALAEDLGRAGDVTTDSIIPADAMATARLNARKDGRVAGLEVAIAAFRTLDPAVEVTIERPDGSDVAPGGTIATVTGRARALLTAERTALNIMGRLSGIATATRALVREVEGTRARIVCTRKTTPGLRVLEKHAVRLGGGFNHRFGLDDAVLIKDNHIAVAGGIRPAVERVRDAIGHMVKVEVEVDTLEQLEELLSLPVDVVLLDNMDPATLRRAVALVDGRLVTEASGNVNLATVRAIAESGVDMISVGWLTHSAPNLDIGLDI